MILSENCRNKIRTLIIGYIKKVNNRRFNTEPWVHQDELICSPFNVRLVPPTIWKSSKYERSFVTGFGGLYEQISKIIGEDNWTEVRTQHSTVLTISRFQRDQISNILDELDHKHPVGHASRRVPNWNSEIRELDGLNNGDKINITVNSDLYLYDRERNVKAFIELKSPKPNKDQTKVSKEKMLKLYCGLKDSPETLQLFYSLPFNPWGERKNYAHSFPFTYFDMKTSPVVNMGKEYWDFIGNQEGTYEELLTLIEEIGNETRESIIKFLN